MHGVLGGLTALQWGHQRVVGGVDRCFAFWVLKSQVGITITIGLRKETNVSNIKSINKVLKN